MTIGELIRQERKNIGMTQDELAKRLGITRSAVGQFEKKDSNLRYDTVKKIAEAMDIPVYRFSLNEGERIRAIRESRGLTQTELGEKVGLSTESIENIEKQEFRPTNAVIIKIAEALNVTPFSLFPGTIDPQDDQPKVKDSDDAVDGLKTIIRKLYTCIPNQQANDGTQYTSINFTKNDHSYHISEEDLRELVPLVDGLVGAYIEQKKVCDL